MANFTDRTLSALKIDAGRKDKLVFDAACPGLGVRVTSAGSKVFILQWTDPATKRKIREKLGVWGSITIEQARSAARVRLGEVAKGVDPRAERQKQKERAERDRLEVALTFDALVSEWAALHLASRRETYRKEAQRAIRLVFASLLKRPAARITRADAVNVLDGLVKDGKAAMAATTLAYARAAYSWAYKRGKVPSNPFQNLPIGTSSVSRDRVLTDQELVALWTRAALNDVGGPCIWTPGELFDVPRHDERCGLVWFLRGETVRALGPAQAIYGKREEILERKGLRQRPSPRPLWRPPLRHPARQARSFFTSIPAAPQSGQRTYHRERKHRFNGLAGRQSALIAAARQQCASRSRVTRHPRRAVSGDSQG